MKACRSSSVGDLDKVLKIIAWVGIIWDKIYIPFTDASKTSSFYGGPVGVLWRKEDIPGHFFRKK